MYSSHVLFTGNSCTMVRDESRKIYWWKHHKNTDLTNFSFLLQFSLTKKYLGGDFQCVYLTVVCIPVNMVDSLRFTSLPRIEISENSNIIVLKLHLVQGNAKKTITFLRKHSVSPKDIGSRAW